MEPTRPECHSKHCAVAGPRGRQAAPPPSPAVPDAGSKFAVAGFEPSTNEERASCASFPEAPIASSAGRSNAAETSPAFASARSLAALQEGQRFFQQQLTTDRLRWFQEITGLPLYAFWHEPLGSAGNSTTLLCPAARARLKSDQPLSSSCHHCCEQCWPPALSLTVAPESFTGHCGLANCSATLEWKHTRPLTLVLQIRPKQNHEPSKRAQTFSSVSIAPGSGSDTNARAPVHREVAGTAPAGFQRAVTILCLLHHDLQTTAQYHLLREDQARIRLHVQHLELEHARLRQGLHGCRPDVPLASARHASDNHSEHVVQAMLDWVGQHYHRPLSLDELAHALRMNPSYLSALFHKTTGVAFHHYLEELRMSKAQELLRDPLIRICEVACAVGYANPNHFRHAFKAREGRAPNAWRQSMPRPESP